MRLRDHLFVSSYLLAICAVAWGLVEILTIFSTITFGNISFVSYISILLLPLVLYGITGLLSGLVIACILFPLIRFCFQEFSFRKEVRLYSLLYFSPLLIAIEYIWNKRYLPAIPFTEPVSIMHSLVILLLTVTCAYLARKLILLAFRGKLPIFRSLVIGLGLGVIAVFYINHGSSVPDRRTAGVKPPTPDTPNVLLITIDTLRADHLGCYGNASINTPVIDALAAGGARYSNATSQVPLTLPSHTSILTSTYPPVHGVRDNARYRFSNSIPTLSEIMQESGYLTSAFVSAFVLDSRFGLDRGFDLYNDKVQNQALFYFFSASPPFALAGGLKLLGLMPPYKPERKANATTDAAIKWIEENQGERFFLWVHYFDPHGPLNPPVPYDTMYLSPSTDREEFRRNQDRYISIQGRSDTKGLTPDDLEGIRALYKGEVTFTDHELGLLLERLNALGLSDRTLVVLTSDHGQSLSEHGYMGHSMELYQEIMHVPLIISWPGTIPSSVVNDPVQSIDIMPTILGLLKIEIPSSCRGRDLLEPPSAGNRLEHDRWAYLETFHPHSARQKLMGLVSGRYKYIRTLEGDREEYYDIVNDPRESDNLAGREPGRTEASRMLLQQMLEEMEKYAASEEIPLDSQTVEAMKALGYIK